MRTLNHYIGRSFTSSFLLTVLVLTFVMSMGSLFRITDMLAKGVALASIAQFFLWSMPALLIFTIPISVLTAVLLVFGRLSHEGELTAMKACGISLWQTARRPILYAVLLSAFCLAMNFEVAPRIEQRQRALMNEMRSDVVLSLLEEGQFVQMAPGFSIYIWRKKGPRLQQVVIIDQSGGKPRRIEARSGTVSVSPDNRFFQLDLRDVRISPFIDGHSASGFCEQWPVRIPIKEKGRIQKPTPSSLTSAALAGELIRMNPVTGTSPDLLEHLRLRVEVNKRMVMALGCLAFVFLGVPLGIRNPRRESSISVGISLFLAFVFYLFVIVAQTLGRRPELFPHLFVWFPIPISIILGSWLIKRMN
jgi:lipopolysaccharide export system permease protein